jgi:predicted alpha/beta-fold hydrolase
MIDDRGYHQIRDFKAFDDRYTAPIHGFRNAEDYWSKCSCGTLLQRIRIPSLIVNAEDDPFLGASCYPRKKIPNSNIRLEYPQFGGHVGFMYHSIGGTYWSEHRAVAFIQGLLPDR